MTTEDKARELAIKCSKTIDDNGNEVYNAFCEAALQEMAEWKEEQMIEKAVKFLSKRVFSYDGCFIDDFRKTMKGE